MALLRHVKKRGSKAGKAAGGSEPSRPSAA
jgi:hypothetical protein